MKRKRAENSSGGDKASGDRGHTGLLTSKLGKPPTNSGKCLMEAAHLSGFHP